jgi:hypothetical protein
MANDQEHEAEALEWCEGLIGDAIPQQGRHLVGLLRRDARRSARMHSPAMLGPFAVIPSPSPVILSEAKNLRSLLRPNCAKRLCDWPQADEL